MNTLLKESNYNIKIELLRGKTLLFNSLSRGLCLLDAEESDTLKKVAQSSQEESGDFFALLLGQGFVVPENIDELEIVKKRYDSHRSDAGSVTLTVCPTLSCNFGCDYCFQGDEKPVGIMSKNVQDGVLQLFSRITEEMPGLHTLRSMWYGGEPLLKPHIIYSLSDRLIELCQSKNINYTASMISNGSLLTKTVAKNLYARGLRSVQITLDGSRKDHDNRRHYLSKKGTYDVIVSHMKSWIYDLPVQVDLRVNLDERNRDGVRALIDDLVKEGLGNLPNLKMYFAPVESVTSGCHLVADKMIRKMQFGRLESELLSYAFENGLANLPYPPYFMGVCSALKKNDFIVVPNGDVHKCWDTVSYYRNKIGSVFTIDRLFKNKSLNQKQWDDFYPFDHPTCKTRKILPNCSSFCAHKFVNASDTLGEASLPCPSLKYSMNEKIILLAEKEGYISHNDYLPEMIRTDPLSLCREVFVKKDYVRDETYAHC